MEIPTSQLQPMEVSVRRASSRDLPRLVELHRAADAALQEQRGGSHLGAERGRGSIAEDVEASLTEELTGQQSQILLGCVGEAIVGHAVLRFPPAVAGTVESRSVAELRELFVDPRARQIGVGSALLEAARDEAASRGCTGIDSVALPGDRATKNFFEDHGMVARAIVVHGSLDP